MLVSLYIRKADEDKWRALNNKTQVISNLLNKEPLHKKPLDLNRMQKEVDDWQENKLLNMVVVNEALSKAKVPTVNRYIATPDGVIGPTRLQSKAMRFCKNGHPIPDGRTKCLGKGCNVS